MKAPINQVAIIMFIVIVSLLAAPSSLPRYSHHLVTARSSASMRYAEGAGFVRCDLQGEGRRGTAFEDVQGSLRVL
jgi:hypothetical protein